MAVMMHSTSARIISITNRLWTSAPPPTMPASASATPEPSTIGVASIPLRPSTPWKVNGTRMNSSMHRRPE